MEKKKKVMVVFGTRPEAIKMCPVITELNKYRGLKTYVVLTGQHKEMLTPVISTFGIDVEDNLEIMREDQSLFDITNAVMYGIKAECERIRPDMVVVHGDTTTAFSAALAAFYMGIKVAHVEAGLRTYQTNSPYPEEFNRRAVAAISNLDFAPTETARNNLLNEGKSSESIFVTGNTVIDALKTTISEDYSHPELDWCKNKKMILITAHRRESIGEPLRNVFRAVKRVLRENDDVRAIYPVHMNPAVREICKECFSNEDRIHVINPLEVVDFHNFMNSAYVILTDSGGVQEEAPCLGKPVLVVRSVSERLEVIEAGGAKLVGTSEEDVYLELQKLISDETEYQKMAVVRNIYGDGTAAKRIAKEISEYFEKE